MKLRMMAVVGALAGLAFVGCQSGNKAPTATGNPVTAQAGTAQGRVTDVDAQSFTLQVPGGDQITLHRSARAGSVNVQKGDDVRASYQVDTDGNKIAQSIQVIHAAPAGQQGTTQGAAGSQGTMGNPGAMENPGAGDNGAMNGQQGAAGSTGTQGTANNPGAAGNAGGSNSGSNP